MAGLIWLWQQATEPTPEPPRPGASWLLGMALQEQRVQLDPMKVLLHAYGAGAVRFLEITDEQQRHAVIA